MATAQRIIARPGTAPLPSNVVIRPPAPAVSQRPRRSPPPSRHSQDSRERPAGHRQLDAAITLAHKHEKELLQYPNVVSVRAGFKFIHGEITQIPAVVIAVTHKTDEIRPGARLPTSIDGVATDVAIADPYEIIQRRAGMEAAVLARPPALLIDEIQEGLESALVQVGEAVPQISYEPPTDGNLDPVTGEMTIICHVSPDAGWRVLEEFLKGTRRKMRLGMYDFTAPHIYRTVRTLLRDTNASWRQTLGPSESLPAEDDVDSTKADDKTEESIVRGLKRVAGSRFANAFARVGAGQTFASAYHIKVAIRDDQALWLSSGNWQSSNQPDIDFLAVDADRKLIPNFNREWHVVIENATLAKRFQRFLEHDFETAQSDEAARLESMRGLPELLVPEEELLHEERGAVELDVFAPRRFTFDAANPLTVQPILTPDNYLDVVLEMLRDPPSEKLYFQNQSLNPIKQPTAEFQELLRLLADYSNDPSLDVRLIFRNIGPVRKKLESLQLAGFNMKRVRIQSGCHTKGIIIDGRTLLLGSHNITNQGVQVNRDASVLIRHEGIARYYERVFLHDWEKLSKPTIREEAAPILPIGEEFESASRVGRRFTRVPWQYFTEE